MSSVQSSLSFKLAPSSLGRNSINTNSFQSYDQSKNHTSNEDAIVANPAQQSCPISDHAISPNIDPSLRLTTPDLMEVDLGDVEATLSLPTAGADHAIPLGDHIDATGLPSPRNSKSPVDPALSLTNFHPTAKPQRGRSQKMPTAPKAPSMLSTKDMFNFSSSSSLTYDSFWSSHTGPTAPQSTRGLHSDNVDYPSTLQPSGSDFNNGISISTYPLNTSASASNNI